MKYSVKLLLLFTMVVSIWSCKKEENRVILEEGTPPVLTSTVTGNIPLSFNTQDDEAFRLRWTNPNYRFNTGTSSQDVIYRIEIDTVGANFTNPKRKVIIVSNDNEKVFTQADLNDIILNQLELTVNQPHQLQVRVQSYLASGAAMLTSNTLSFTATPYSIPPKVTPPASGTLFIVGSATPGGWNNPVPVPSQQFTQVFPTLYEITLPLTGGEFYLLLPVNGDWSAKFGAMGANGSNNPGGDDFRSQGGDMIAPATSGNYKITVNFQTGKFTVTPN